MSDMVGFMSPAEPFDNGKQDTAGQITENVRPGKGTAQQNTEKTDFAKTHPGHKIKILSHFHCCSKQENRQGKTNRSLREKNPQKTADQYRHQNIAAIRTNKTVPDKQGYTNFCRKQNEKSDAIQHTYPVSGQRHFPFLVFILIGIITDSFDEINRIL